MTYGEAVMFQKLTMRMQNGVWVSDPMPAHVRLSEQEALEYYGAKLDRYWLSRDQERICGRCEMTILLYICKDE